MHRTLPYLALFAVVVLLQVFLFDNPSISIYLNPHFISSCRNLFQLSFFS